MADADHVEALIDRNRPKLLECITVDEMLLGCLVAENVLRDDQMQNIRGMIPLKKISEILDIVRADPRKLKNLCKALQYTKQERAHSILTIPESVPTSIDQPDSANTAEDEQLAAGLEKLKNYYRKKFTKVPSFFSTNKTMDMNYVKTDLTEITKEANILSNGLQVDENSLFEKGKQVLIDGEAGSGKSTLANRYAWQWAEKEGPEFINNFLLVICCTGSSIDDHRGINSRIKIFLSEFDHSDSLYHYYKIHQKQCLVIFEAMGDANEFSQSLVYNFLEIDKQQPVIVTARTDDSFKIPMNVHQFRRNLFSKKQALKYFINTFPEVEKEVIDLLASETIDTKLLETPYNCQGLGELLIKKKSELLKKSKSEQTTQFQDGRKLTATLLISRQIEHLQENQTYKIDDSYLANLAKLALLGTIKEKQDFKRADLLLFKIEGTKELLNFMTNADYMYNFHHKLLKDYLAALAVIQLDPHIRNEFYKFLSSERKYVAVVRFICGLLDTNGSDGREEFRSIAGHMKLLGEIKHLQTKEKDTVIQIASHTVNSTLEEFCRRTPSKPYAPSPEEELSLANYEKECKCFTDGTLSDHDKLSLLDGDNGRSCFSWRTLELFEDIYTCLHELPITNKHDLDIMKKLLPLEKDDPIQGKMYVFPVAKSERWGQILLKRRPEGDELWILTHTVKDARKALQQKVPNDFDPKVVGVCIPSSHARTLWGIPQEETLKFFCNKYLKNMKKLRTFSVWLETPLQLTGALPTGLEHVRMTLFPYDVNDVKTWQKFLDYVSPQCISGVEVCYATANMMTDGFLTALSQERTGQISVQEFRALDGEIGMKEALGFKQAFQLKDLLFQFDRTLIYDIESILDAVSIMNDNFVIAASLKQSKKITFGEEDCNRAMAAKWSSTEPTNDTKKLYLNMLENISSLDADNYELPSCYREENRENMEELLDDALEQFDEKWTDQLTVTIKTNIVLVTQRIAEAAKSNGFTVRWLWHEKEQIYIAELTHKRKTLS